MLLLSVGYPFLTLPKTRFRLVGWPLLCLWEPEEQDNSGKGLTPEKTGPKREGYFDPWIAFYLYTSSIFWNLGLVSVLGLDRPDTVDDIGTGGVSPARFL